MTRKPDTWMPLNIGKYLGDTAHLTREQHGAYLLLLMAYWMRGGPLPADDGRMAAIAKATAAEWRRLKPVLAEFFTEQDGHWHQKKAEEELAKANGLTEAKAIAGKKGADKRWHSNGTANSKQMAEPSNSQWQTDAPLPSPIPIQKEDTSLRSVVAVKPIIAIPEWIPNEPWAGFVEMRRKIKRPLTDRGILLTISALKKLKHTEDIGAVLDQSTVNNWKGVFRVKHEQEGYGQRQKPATAHDKFFAAGASIINELFAGEGEGEGGENSADVVPFGRPLLSA